MEEFPYAYMIFIPFVLISAFIIMNVFIGVIVNSIYEVSGLKQNLEKEDVQASLVKPAKVSPLAEAKTPQIVGPDHLLGMGSGYIALREQLNRIEDMLRSLTK